MKTHYEKFVDRIGPYRSVAKKACDILASDYRKIPEFENNCIANDPGVWIAAVVKNKGIASNGKQEVAILREGSVKKCANSMDAFIWEIYSRIFRQNENPDGTWSLTNCLFKNKQFILLQGSLASVAGGSNRAQALCEVAYHCLTHERAGKRVYEVAPGLAEKLKYTELRGLMSTDIQLPFNNIYITVPKEADFKLYNELDRQWHDLEGVYIVEDKYAFREPDPPHQVDLSPQGELVCSDGIDLKDRERTRCLSIMLVGGPGKDKNGNPIPDDDALFFFRIYLDENQTIDQCVDDCHRRNEQTVTFNQAALRDKMESKWDAMFRWCLNVVMYATCIEPDETLLDKESRKLWERIQAAPEGSKTRKNLQKKFDSGNQNKRVILGRNIVIDRTKAEHVESTPTGRKITVRTRVAGHWRRVRYGKNWELRRMTFVEPFWRGPELGEEVVRKHVLK